MPDLLTHVFVAYALATIVATRYRWISPAYVTLAMVGALIPDLDHISVLVPRQTVEAMLGVPFDWVGLQTGGVVLLVVLAGTVLVDQFERRRVFIVLSLGAASHLFTDVLIMVPDGRGQSIFWPLTKYQPPSPGLYTNTDLWPLVTAGTVAFISWYIVRYRSFEEVP